MMELDYDSHDASDVESMEDDFYSEEMTEGNDEDKYGFSDNELADSVMFVSERPEVKI